MPDIVTTAIGLKPKEAIDFLRQKVGVTSTHWTDVWQEAHARSFMVAGAATQALVDDFHAEVLKAIDNGTTLADFRKEFDRLVEKHGWVHNGSPGWRAGIIYETNLSMAYSAGQYAQMTRPATLAVFPYWQYVHTTSAHPRVQHLAWAGLTLRADDPWWDTHYPPNGWRCKCGVRPVMRSELARMGKDGPDEAPAIVTRKWTNPHTGRTYDVPKGIDPGFDYNVGKAGLDARPPDGALATSEPAATSRLKAEKVVPPPPAELPIPETYRYASVKSADAALKRVYRETAETLDPDQRTAVAIYQGNWHGLMNAALRGKAQGGLVKGFVEQLNAAMAKAAPLPRSLQVFRGVHGSYADKLRAAVPGAILSEAGFTSTSIDEAQAEKFAAGDGVVLQIVVAKGQKALYVPAIVRKSGLNRERELLLPSGSRFRVLRNDGHRLVLELL